ncbi:MAG: type II toxin-antitoxin system VapC family toxin [Candidatus Humimicrobiaceae bacterium]
MDIVLDASVAVKWFSAVNEDNVETALQIQRLKIINSLEIVVPDLFFLEIINAFISKSKFGLKDVCLIEETLYKMNLKIIFPDHLILKNSIEIADKSNLTIYDSLYISVAQVFEALLLTADKKILANKSKYSFIKSLEEFKNQPESSF